MLGWDTEEAENVWWMAQDNYWMIQTKVNMPKYGGQPDIPLYIWVWSIVQRFKEFYSVIFLRGWRVGFGSPGLDPRLRFIPGRSPVYSRSGSWIAGLESVSGFGFPLSGNVNIRDTDGVRRPCWICVMKIKGSGKFSVAPETLKVCRKNRTLQKRREI